MDAEKAPPEPLLQNAKTLIDMFLANYERSENSRRAYRTHMRKFFEFVELRSIPLDNLFEVSPQLFSEFKIFRESEGDSCATLNSRLGAIRAFFRWLTEQFPHFINPARDTALPRPKVRTAPTIAKDDISKLRKVAANRWAAQQRDLQAARTWCMFELMLHTGLRPGETVALKMSQLEELLQFVDEVLSSGYELQTVPIVRNIRALVNLYLQVRENFLQTCCSGYTELACDLKDELPIFVTSYYPSLESPEKLQINKKTAWRSIHELGIELGIKKLSPRTLRHTFGYESFHSSSEFKAVRKKLRLIASPRSTNWRLIQMYGKGRSPN